MSENQKYEYMTIEVDADLLEKVTPIFANYGLTVEQAIVRFFTWVAKCPEQAKPYLLELREKYESMIV